MDIHTRIVAVLHIVYGLLGALLLLGLALAIGGFAAFLPMPDLPGFVLSAGVWLFALFMLVGLAEVVAGVALLRGSPTGKVFVIVFGVLDLLHFPFGTVLGIYTLWALLRKQPLQQSPVA